MEIQKNIKRITILDGFSFPSDDEDDFFLNGDEPDKDSSAFPRLQAIRLRDKCTIIRLHS